MSVHDYNCTRCRQSFTVVDPIDDEPVLCPECGSDAVHEGWESRVRNARGRKPPRPIEEMRDRVG